MNGLISEIAKKVGLTSAQVASKHLDDVGGLMKGKTNAAAKAIVRATKGVDSLKGITDPSTLSAADLGARNLDIRNATIRGLQVRRGAGYAGGAVAGGAGFAKLKSSRKQAKMQAQGTSAPMSSYQGPMQPGIGSGRYA